jgi:hypothetical protein
MKKELQEFRSCRIGRYGLGFVGVCAGGIRIGWL